MDPRFNDIVGDPQNQIFQVVFFPDRVYHAQYLNATRSPRYRYNVTEVRGKADINVLKGEVYLDDAKLCNFLRVEYRAGRLAEAVRERSRFLGPNIAAYVSLARSDGKGGIAESEFTMTRLHFCPWVRAYQVEFWETLEPPPGKRHDFQVLDLMGYRGSITRTGRFSEILRDGNLKRFDLAMLAFGEDDATWPDGVVIEPEAAAWDNFFRRNVQKPVKPIPSSLENTVPDMNYGVHFQRGWFFEDVGKIDPVRYSNGMMEPENPAYDRSDPPTNIIEMRWVLQQEMGGTVVFFHEVTIPPGTFEGVHQHIGSEELYFVIEGEGTAYMGADDDPTLAAAPLIEQYVYGFGPKQVREVKVKPRSVIYTKSGGIHGIRNDSPDKNLRFVAFLYHSS